VFKAGEDSVNRIVISTLVALLVSALGCAAVPLLAHHGRGAAYDNDATMMIKGTITEWAYRNPHAVLYVDVREADGKVINWGFETSNVSTLSRLGIFRNSFRAGQQVTIKFNPARNGTPLGVLRNVYDLNGKELM
jgi:hypothetical protein